MSGLESRTALVTGGGRGIGRAIALELAARGAHVAVAARSKDELDETARLIRDTGGEAHTIVADLAVPAGGERLAGRALAELERVDILVNNAAVVAPLGPTVAVDPEHWRTAVAVNLTSVVALSCALLPGMLERRWGRVVNVSSAIAAHPEAMVGANAYATTKAALEAHTLNLAAELDGTGVSVNAFRPGSVETAMQEWIRNQDPDEIGRALHARFTRRHAAGVLITPAQSAAALMEHLEDEATGRIWDVADRAAPTPNISRGTR